MNKFLWLLFFSLPLTLQAQIAPLPYNSVGACQQRVWDLTAKLSDANLNLSLMKLDWQRAKLMENLTKAQQKGDATKAQTFQQKINEVDHRKMVEKQKHDLNAQLLQARIDKDQGKADAIIFQLKELQ